jgi:hypothetical protein
MDKEGKATRQRWGINQGLMQGWEITQIYGQVWIRYGIYNIM